MLVAARALPLLLADAGGRAGPEGALGLPSPRHGARFDAPIPPPTSSGVQSAPKTRPCRAHSRSRSRSSSRSRRPGSRCCFARIAPHRRSRRSYPSSGRSRSTAAGRACSSGCNGSWRSRPSRPTAPCSCSGRARASAIRRDSCAGALEALRPVGTRAWMLTSPGIAWSPRRDRAAVSTDRGIELLDPAGAPRRLLARGLFDAPAWSADGRTSSSEPGSGGPTART